MSRLGKSIHQSREATIIIPLLTAYSAIAGGAAKDQLRGRREFVY
jgi:hypothetical protein